MGLPITLDSWWEPDDATIAAAKARGYVGWCGYFQERAHDGIYHGWQDATFRRILAAGLHTYAYCSGWDDPAYVRSRAAALGITAILDVETSIRGDGAWVDAWLATSGASLYGVAPTIEAHAVHGHAGYVHAGYPGGDPGVCFPPTIHVSPARPLAWQYTDTISMSGGSCDGSHFDTAWGTVTVDMTPEQAAQLNDLYLAVFGPTALNGGIGTNVSGNNIDIIRRKLSGYTAGYPAASGAEITASGSGGLTAEQASELTAAVAALGRVETALKGA